MQIIFFFLALLFAAPVFSQAVDQEQNSASLPSFNERVLTLYEMEDGETLRDITEEVLAHPDTSAPAKENILSTGRRIYLFRYPSEGLWIKGFLSIVPSATDRPLLLFLRGGNRLFGVPHPGKSITCFQDYPVLATTYRGGVSEGEDEFGGGDVEDVHNLLLYVPELEKLLHQPLSERKWYLYGISRGGMELMLFLSRHPEWCQKISAAVVNCGVLDLSTWIAERGDIDTMLHEEYDLADDPQEWIAERDPMQHLSSIPNDFPIYILQGTADDRVSPQIAKNMVHALIDHSQTLAYQEIPEGNHCLTNDPTTMFRVWHWLEQF